MERVISAGAFRCLSTLVPADQVNLVDIQNSSLKSAPGNPMIKFTPVFSYSEKALRNLYWLA